MYFRENDASIFPRAQRLVDDWGHGTRVLLRHELGETPPTKPYTPPSRVRLGLRPPPPHYLAFLKLDQFKWNEALLTPRLMQMVAHLAEQVRASWKSIRPIGFIRLVGHTDNTGPARNKQQFNIDLGNRRAAAVKEALQDILKEDILTGRIRIAILVDPSPGESKPVASNATNAGRALNRRVEVFIEPLDPPPAPPEPPPSGPDFDKAVEEASKKIEERAAQQRYNRPIPTLPGGKSFKQFVDDWLRDHHVSKWLRNKIWEAIFGKDFSAVNSLLDLAGVSKPEKDAFLQIVRAVAEAPVR